MSTAAEHLHFTAEAYLAWEAEQAGKHEFVRGEVFAMTGTSDRHNDIMLNCIVALRPQLQGKPCRLYAADVKLRVEAVDAFFYPDLFITCSAADHADRHVKREAGVVIEILSPATAAYDRGAKFDAYRQLPSLREYVLIDPERISVHVYHRNEDGHWTFLPYTTGETVELSSLGLQVPVAGIYAGTEPSDP